MKLEFKHSFKRLFNQFNLISKILFRKLIFHVLPLSGDLIYVLRYLQLSFELP